MLIIKYFNYIKKIDWLLLVPILLLIFFGLATLYGGTLNVENPNWIFFNKQLVFFIIGMMILIGASIMDYRKWRSYSLFLYIIGIILMGLVLIWGQNIRGTTGWFYIFGFGLQPVEFMKFSLVLILAYIYSKRKDEEKKWSTIFLIGSISLGPVILAILQPDFGSAIILGGIGLGFYALIGMKKQHLIFLLLILIVGSMIIWNFVLLDYHKERIMTFISPTNDPLDKGYNVRQSIVAVGSGRLLGRGIGLGTQSQLRFLPEVKTDFIFATIAETLGFVGITVLIILFTLFFIRLLYIIRQAKDSFSLYITYGLAIMFFIQTIINIGMNIGLFPIVGLSLPFVSYGGSFLLISMLAVGVMESISLRQKTL